MQYNHSIKVPQLYKAAAKILKEVKENSGSLKQLVYEKKHFNIKALYALIAIALQRFSELDSIISKSQLLVKEPHFDQWLARILVTELLWGKKKLTSDSTPVKTLLSYRHILEKYQNDNIEESCEDDNKKVQKPRFVRINTLLITPEEAINGFRDEGWKLVRFFGKSYDEFLERISSLNEDEFMVDVHIKELLIFPPNATFYRHPAYKMGSILLQDKASCLPSHLLNPPPGSVVLDMCAAPGMKTTHLAALMGNQGTLYAVEMDKNRFNTLNTVIEKIEDNCIKTINSDVLKLTPNECPDVEYILVDPSCSGSGITNRVSINGKKDEPDSFRLGKLSGFQIKILKHALLHFPKCKRVVYSTCSIYRQENEYVVEEVLNSLKDVTQFKLVNAKNLLDGPWKSSSGEEGSVSENCLCMKPENDLTNGFFVAVFERTEFDKVLEQGTNSKKIRKNKQTKTQSDDSHNDDKSMNEDEEIHNDQNNDRELVDGATYQDNSLIASRKSKKKKNKKIDPKTEHSADIRENTDFEETTTKHIKKKKRKHSEKELDENNCANKKDEDENYIEEYTQEDDSSNTSTKCAKKKKNINTSEYNNVTVAQENNLTKHKSESNREDLMDEDIKRSRKKKHKHFPVESRKDNQEEGNKNSTVEQDALSISQAVNDGYKTEKKKKKKKLKELENAASESNAIVMNESSLNERSADNKKDKKKRKKSKRDVEEEVLVNESGLNNSDYQEETNCEGIKTKKKKKNRGIS